MGAVGRRFSDARDPALPLQYPIVIPLVAVGSAEAASVTSETRRRRRKKRKTSGVPQCRRLLKSANGIESDTPGQLRMTDDDKNRGD